MSEDRPTRRTLGYVSGWLVAAALAVVVGVLAVSSLGASIRDRGPVVTEAIRTAQLEEEGQLQPAPEDEAVREEISDEFGVFVVECRGVVAYGVDVAPAPGWRSGGFDPGPDDDVDAIFTQRERSIEIEVFCNRGRPTVAEIERKSLPDDD